MILATAGHIDHGKTALVRALTGIDADRLPEEKRRGMTIDLGFAYAGLPDGSEIGFVDVPGHERFLPNMLAGVLGIDRVLLVVAADDGPRPQTLEHLDVLDLIGAAEVTGILTKIDRVAPERTASVVGEVGRLLAEAGFADSPLFAVSSRTGDGIPALVAHLEESARRAEAARTATPARGLFRMPIDRVFSLSGIGTVVTGTVAAGAVVPGERLLLGRRGLAVRVRGLHAQNRTVERAAAGERCAINIAGAFPAGGEPRRGDWILAAERHAPTRRIDLRVRVSRFAAAPLRDGLPVHLHLGTADVVGRLALLEGRALAAGATGFVQLDLEHPIGALHGDRAVLRDHAARHTLAGGRVVDPFAPRRGRRQPARLATLAALAEADPGAALTRLLAQDGVVDLPRFALARNLAPAELDALGEGEAFRRLGPARAGVAVTAQRLALLCAEVEAALAAYHEAQADALGPSRAALAAAVRRRRGPGTPLAAEAVLDAALAELAASGRVVREGAVWHLPAHRPRLSAADERLWQRIEPLLAAGVLRPPRVRELAGALGLEPPAVERFLARAERFGRLARVADNRFYLPEAVTRLAALARELADASPDGTFTAAAFKDHTGVGRNLTINILEFFDRVGITRRVGDVRMILGSGSEPFV